MIYFLLAEQIKILKIGYTKHPNFYLSGRFEQAVKQIPEIPRLIGVMEGDLSKESQLHKYYNGLRIHRIFTKNEVNWNYDNSPFDYFGGNDYEWFLYKEKLLNMYKDWPIAKIIFDGEGPVYEEWGYSGIGKWGYMGKTKKDKQIIEKIKSSVTNNA